MKMYQKDFCKVQSLIRKFTIAKKHYFPGLWDGEGLG